MKTFLIIVSLIFTIEMWVLWWMCFYEDSFEKAMDELEFFFAASCAMVCYFTLGQESTISQVKPDGEIIKEIEIG